MAAIQPTYTDSQIVGAGGTCTITIRPTNQVIWTVSQVTIEMVPQPEDSQVPSGAVCNLRKNGYLVTPMVPNADAAGGDPPMQILPSDILTVEWSGCQPGHIGKVMAVYDVGNF